MMIGELTLCSKVGDILIICQNLSLLDRNQLLKAWLRSSVFNGIINGDIVYRSQAKSYVADEVLKECENQLSKNQPTFNYREDALFWFGFITTYWCF